MNTIDQAVQQLESNTVKTDSDLSFKINLPAVDKGFHFIEYATMFNQISNSNI